MKILNEYETHHYLVDYEKEDMYCPYCGAQTVWKEFGNDDDDDNDDYNLGTDHVCVTCNSDFTIQGPGHAKKEIVSQILSGICGTPKTPKGN